MELKNNLVIDYETFKAALTEILLADSSSFRSLYPGSTANIFTEALSGYAAMLMYRLQTAITNSFLKTAFSEHSIFSIAEMLGVIIRGNTGSVVEAVLSRQPFTGATTLPPFTIPTNTSFTINGLPFYNKVPLTFPSGYTSLSATLYQGEIKKKEYTTSGALNEKFVFGDSFTTDISVVRVYVNGVEWKTDYETIMDYTIGEENSEESVRCVLLKTNVDGTCYIQFGNNIYGLVPPAGSIVDIYYASTVGAAGNFTGATDVTINDNLLFGDEILEIYSNSISAATGGTDRLSADALKYISPRLFASNNRAVKRSDYIGQFLYNFNYKDCNFWGEYEEAKKEGYADNSMMNKSFYTAITNDFSVKTIPFAVGDGETKTFKQNVPSIIMFPGSVEIKNGEETFRDYSGQGYLFSMANDYTVQQSTLLDEAGVSGSIKASSVGNFCALKTTISWIEDGEKVVKTPREKRLYNLTHTITGNTIFFIIGDMTYYLEFESDNFPLEKGKTYSTASLPKLGRMYYETYKDGEKVQVIKDSPELKIEDIIDYQFPIENVKIIRDDDGIMTNSDTSYQSSTIPSSEIPIIIEFTLPNEKVLSGIRLFSTSYATVEDRSFPSKVIVVASKSATPKKDFDSYMSEAAGRWTFKELMHDEEWTHLTSAVSIPEPGVSGWSDWVGVNTLQDSYSVKVYRNGGIETDIRDNKYAIYRLIILDRHGSSSQETTKIGKIAFMTKNASSKIDYDTGEATISFLNPPKDSEEITATSIGDKVSEYQKLRDYAFLKKINHFTTEVEFSELHLKRVDIDIDVCYSNSADLSTLKGEVETAITGMFEVTQGIIGKGLYISQLYSTVMDIEGVSYCRKNLPVDDVVADVNEVLYLSSLKINYIPSTRIGG